MQKKKTGAGAATTAGTTFQENVAAWLVCQILAGPNRTNDLGLPADVQLETIECESLQPIDDIEVGATDRTLYFQCKTTLSIGNNDVFVGVIRQFVSQYLQGGTARDRYILAVSDEASAVLRNDLRHALESLRAKRGHEREEQLGQLGSVRSSYDRLEETVREQLQVLRPNSPFEDEEVFSVIDRVAICAASYGAGTCTPDAATDKLALVLTKPEDAKRAWERIVNIVRGFSPNRTGGDRVMFVRDLRDEGLIAKPLEAVREAIESLQAKSRDHLESLSRHASIRCGNSKTVEINRPIVQQIYQELQSGDLLLSGDAGAGKTGCLVQVAQRLIQEEIPHLIIPVEQVFSDHNWQTSIGLATKVTLTDVLTNWPADKVGVVCLDGLDSARSSVSLNSVLNFIHQLRTAAPEWRVLASIREFDLEKSHEMQRLFRGSVSDARLQSKVSGVRAVRIPELTEDEIGQLYGNTPKLQEILTGENAAGLWSVVKNVFNLDLLVDLLTSPVSEHDLRAIDTQDKLLETYWNIRIRDDSKRIDLLASLTRQMVDSRSLAIHVVPELMAKLADLLRISVLMSEPGLLPEDSQLVRYRHNILFDYAASRLWLKGLNDPNVNAELATSPELALIFRPSLRMTLQRLWRSEPTRSAFWSRVKSLFQVLPDRKTEIFKFLLVQVASEEFRKVENMTPLISNLDEQLNVDLLERTIAAALLRLRVDRETFDIVGPDAREWLQLGQALAQCDVSRFLFPLRNLLVAVLDENPGRKDQLTMEQKLAFSVIACKLLEACVSAGIQHINGGILPVALRSCIFATAWDKGSPIAAIRRAIEPDFLEIAGFVVLPILGKQIIYIADLDEYLAADVFQAYSTASALPNNQVTSLGGGILPLSSTASQDLSMFEYSVGEVFKTLVSSHPRLAANVMRQILWNQWNKRELDRSDSLEASTAKFAFENRQRIYVRDHSFIWDGEFAHSKRRLWKIAADTVFNALQADTTADSVRQSLFDEVLGNADLGAIWNRLLQVGAILPERFGKRLAPLLTQTIFLRSFETRHTAGQLLQIGFETWDEAVRRQIESAIMQVGHEVKYFQDDSQEAAERARDSLIACLQDATIISGEVRELSVRIHSDNSAAPPRIPFRLGPVGFISDEEHLQRDGHLETAVQKRFFDLTQEIERLTSPSAPLKSNDVPRALEVISAYEDALCTAESDAIAKSQIECSDGKIAAAFSSLADVENLQTDDRNFILQRLLKFSIHDEPTWEFASDADWDKPLPHWGSPFPRIEAAWGLMKFVRGATAIDEQTLLAIVRLADDPVPAVRYPIVQGILTLFDVDAESFWELIQSRVETEERLSLLENIVNVLIRFSPIDKHADRIDQLLRRIETRIENREGTGFVRESMVVHHLRRVIYSRDIAAEKWLEAVRGNPLERSDELHELLRLWGEMLSEPQSTSDVTADELTVKGIQTLVLAFDVSYSYWLQKPWEAAEKDQERKIYDCTVLPMRQVVDTTSLLLDQKQQPKNPAPRTDHERVRKAVELFRPLIEKCVIVPFNMEVYQFLMTLQYISSVVPDDALLWVRTLIQSAETQGFLTDSMGADLLIGMLERYFVEHRGLINENAAVREAMIDLLNDCVRFRWPKAGPLLLRLNEVFRA